MTTLFSVRTTPAFERRLKKLAAGQGNIDCAWLGGGSATISTIESSCWSIAAYGVRRPTAKNVSRQGLRHAFPMNNVQRDHAPLPRPFDAGGHEISTPSSSASRSPFRLLAQPISGTVRT